MTRCAVVIFLPAWSCLTGRLPSCMYVNAGSSHPQVEKRFPILAQYQDAWPLSAMFTMHRQHCRMYGPGRTVVYSRDGMVGPLLNHEEILPQNGSTYSHWVGPLTELYRCGWRSSSQEKDGNGFVCETHTAEYSRLGKKHSKVLWGTFCSTTRGKQDGVQQ